MRYASYPPTIIPIVSPDYVYFYNKTFRIGVRSGEMVIDQTITATGFTGTEDVDWEELQSFTRP